MTGKKKEMYQALIDLGSTEAVDLLLNFHGTGLLNDDFFDFLIEEGVIQEEDDTEEFNHEDES